MKVVEPRTITTLLLGPDYLPFGIASARAAFHSLLSGKGYGLDANGAPYKWDGYINRSISVLPDSPVMRSGFNIAYRDNVWPIPTLFVVNSKFFFRRKKKTEQNPSLPPLREVYEFYHGICCFCHEKIKFADASREHIHSRALGGTNHEDNIALSCKRCNSIAGHHMPKMDKFGNEVEAKMRVRPAHYVLPQGVEPRKEWMPYLFLS